MKTIKIPYNTDQDLTNLFKQYFSVVKYNYNLFLEFIKIYNVDPVYSSSIGNLKYEYTNAINSSIGIGRRGLEFKVNKNKKDFFPNLLAKHQWKEMATKFKDWKDVFPAIKNLKFRYRVSLDEVKTRFRVFLAKFKSEKYDFKLCFFGSII